MLSSRHVLDKRKAREILESTLASTLRKGVAWPTEQLEIVP